MQVPEPLQSLLHAATSLADKPYDLLHKLKEADELLLTHVNQLDGLLHALAPRRSHTLAWCFILKAKATAVPLSDPDAVQTFFDQCRDLMLDAEPQHLRMVPAHLAATCAKFAAAAVAIGTPLRAVAPLTAAALTLQPTPAHFTPIHSEAMHMCLVAQCYSAAEPLLAQELLEVDRARTAVAPRDLLLYHYYSGLVCVGLKRFGRAVEYFTLCYSAPSQVLNAIMVEAYQKCALCSLLDRGAPLVQPRYTSGVLQRHTKSAASPYAALVEAFGSRKLDALRASLEEHSAAFEADGNLGIAKQCVPALIRLNIQRLASTYSSISLGDLAAGAGLDGPAEAERYVVRMAAEGAIGAAIDGTTGLVRFTEVTQKHDTPEGVANFEAAVTKAIALADELATLNDALLVDPRMHSGMDDCGPGGRRRGIVGVGFSGVEM